MGMTIPEEHDTHGRTTESWPKHVHGTYLVDEVIDGPGPGGGRWPRPAEARAKRRLLIGIFNEGLGGLIKETIQQAAHQNFGCSDDLDVVLCFDPESFYLHAFSREGEGRAKPENNSNERSIENAMNATPSKRQDLLDSWN